MKTFSLKCYSPLSYDILSVLSIEIENIFFEILFPNSKPITVGTIYRPTNQSNFLEVLNNTINKIDSINSEIYIHGDFNINLYLNDSDFLDKKNILSSKSN